MRYETEAKVVKTTLDTRTHDFLKEKEEIRKALEKALADLQCVDINQRKVHGENSKLKEEVIALGKSVSDYEF